MSDTQSVSERFPEDDLPGTGLFFDDTANEPESSVPAAADPIPDEAPGPEEPSAHRVLSTGGAALAGLDPAAVEKLLTKVALRRYTKRIEEAVDARLDDLDWSEVAAGIETRMAAHVAEAAGVNTETGEISDDPAAAVPKTAEAAPVTDETEEEASEPAFRTVYDFYEGIYGPLYEHYDSAPGVMAQRGTTEIRWCRQWWNHQSVMMRMTALWQGYEVAYAEGGGAVSTWVLDHADRHFDRIMSDGGPLSECRADHGNQMVRYPTDPLPEGLNLDAATVPPTRPVNDSK
ncbi:DUF4913 domain-containing protein (plasmid) [Pseudarthrobacter psychrotolerans]|uniref:DUF4913 domain-containing protein n=1 Tax=Pseudarthrobacter psychrotolerans TaxID=2697569 RepID=A0A6P1NPP2_9MICC|nr:DUF4913 domain-containing protein [Pseudarthrobacter psychrotolerans]QHK22655.1 DUF4913 domain-containing protein [Pseudarthrobacter psychrotolerans]